MCCSTYTGVLPRHTFLQSEYGNGQGKLVIGPLCLKIFNSGTSRASHAKPKKPQRPSIGRRWGVSSCSTISESGEQGNRYVSVVEDYFTKYVNLYALPSQTAQSVTQCLFEDYVLVHGIPEAVHSDQGQQFQAEIVQRL